MDSQSLKYLAVDRGKLTDAAAQAEWTSKRLVWVPHGDKGFITGSIKEDRPAKEEYVVELEDGTRQTVPKDDVQKMNPPKFDKVEDMAELTCLNEASVLHNLRDRYYSGLIYTYSGLFCVVVNPYRPYPIYTERVVEAYKGKKRHEMPPHIYAITDTAYRSMMEDRENQSILCTGESGAGKTENTKKVIQYLAIVAGTTGKGSPVKPTGKALERKSTSSSLMSKTGMTMHQGELEQQLLQANPIMESFGNAKTVKNDNSSRFGKFIRVKFDANAQICGASIDTYLLEKSRAVRQAPGERTFHVFYQLLHGASSKERSEFLLGDINSYRFLSHGNEMIQGVSDAAELEITREAMGIMGFSLDEVNSVFKIISSVLHFGNMVFKQERNSDQAVLPDNTVAQKICHLLGVSVTDFTKGLLKPKVKVGREIVTRAQSKEQVEFSVEATAKALYERLFKWLVQKINKSLDRTRREGTSFIGILDIAGFEIFQLNSFEQMCINYTNEKLQQLFNHHMFILEQEEYRIEGIEWTFIDFGLDLQPCIDLIEKHPMGILPLLDEECWFPKATDKSFVEKIDREFISHQKYKKPDFRSQADFTVVHYAGNVDYNAKSWLVKNMDPLNDNLTALLHKSSDPFVESLWKDLTNVHGMPDSSAFGASRPRKGMFRTVGQLYKEQLNSLMTTLRNTTPNFVRCIIPNYEKKAGKLVAPLVLEQLRCNGVLEGIRICRQGFPNRVLFQEFKQRYEILTPTAIPKGFMDGRKACQLMLEALDLDENLYRIGLSKVFFRAGVLGHLEEERDMKLTEVIIGIQAYCRGMLARQKYRKRVQQSIAIRVVQRNVVSYLKLRNWPWWRLFTKVKPLLNVTRQEDEMRAKEKELKDIVNRTEKSEFEMKELQRTYQQILTEKASLAEQLQQETENASELEEARNSLAKRKMELEDLFKDTEARLADEEEKNDQLMHEKQQKDLQIHELEDTIEEEESLKQKLQLEKNQLESKLKSIESDLVSQEDLSSRLAKDKKLVEEKLTDVQVALSAAEDKAKNLTKTKNKQEQIIADLEERLRREEKLRQELEKEKRKLEAEIRDLKEQLENARQQISELQSSLQKRDTELTSALQRLDEESATRTSLDKASRELKSQVQELQEDLENERSQKARIEKTKRELSQELEGLRDELSETTNLTEVQRTHQQKREAELDNLKKTLDQEVTSHEVSVAELKHQHQRAMDDLSEQLDSTRRSLDNNKKLKGQLDQDKSQLVIDLENERHRVGELSRKQKGLEGQVHDLVSKCDGSERELSALKASNFKLKAELEKASSASVDFESQCAHLSREKHSLENHINELQDSLSEESQAKTAALSKLRMAESDLDRTQEILDEEEENKANTARQIASLQQQLTENQQKLSEATASVEDLDGLKKKLYRDIDGMNARLEEMEAMNKKLEKSKKRLMGELEDLGKDSETQRAALTALEKKQKKFDQTLNDEKAVSERYALERDAAQREAREAATKTMNLQRDIEELEVKFSEVERYKKQLQSELDAQLESKDDVGKSMHDLEKTKRMLEAQLEEQKTNIEELEDEFQLSEDAKLRLEVNMQALKAQMDKELQQKEELSEESRRSVVRQLRELESELDEERKTRSKAVADRKRLEAELTDIQLHYDQVTKEKEDTYKQMKKYLNQIKDFHRDLDDARSGLSESSARAKEAEKKARNLEGELQALQDNLSTAERGKRQAETERDELQDQLSGNHPKLQLLTEEKKRLEAKLNGMEDDMEEMQVELEQMNGQLRKSTMQCDSLNQELYHEKSTSQKMESAKSALEKEAKELKARLSELEDGSRARGKMALANMEKRLHSAEEELETRTRECNGALKANRRLEKRMKDLVLQAEDERRHADQYKEQADRMNNRVKSLKRQVDDAEEEVTRINASKRKLQRELDEAIEEKEQIRQEMSNYKAKSSRSGRSHLGTSSRSGRRSYDWGRADEAHDGSSVASGDSRSHSPQNMEDM
eukprot:m.14044 g.14044  ORF g.14044 m.14044 type:complete len:1988 (+) comp25432_c0_seq1:98-6061(+)